MPLIFLILLVIILAYLFTNKTIEKYAPYPYSLHSYFLKPIWQLWNIPTRSTRGMSYDLRGDPLAIPNYYVSPWLQSSLFPIQNKPLWMVS